jgi:hypothetical protein
MTGRATLDVAEVRCKNAGKACYNATIINQYVSRAIIADRARRKVIISLRHALPSKPGLFTFYGRRPSPALLLQQLEFLPRNRRSPSQPRTTHLSLRTSSYTTGNHPETLGILSSPLRISHLNMCRGSAGLRMPPDGRRM